VTDAQRLLTDHCSYAPDHLIDAQPRDPSKCFRNSRVKSPFGSASRADSLSRARSLMPAEYTTISPSGAAGIVRPRLARRCWARDLRKGVVAVGIVADDEGHTTLVRRVGHGGDATRLGENRAGYEDNSDSH
jgi:hypothetical protein